MRLPSLDIPNVLAAPGRGHPLLRADDFEPRPNDLARRCRADSLGGTFELASEQSYDDLNVPLSGDKRSSDLTDQLLVSELVGKVG
jgi:hypothetical protein